MQTPSTATDAPKSERGRRRLISRGRTLYASPYGTMQSASTATTTPAPTTFGAHPTHASAQQPSSLTRRETASPTAVATAAASTTTRKERSRGGSVSTVYATKPHYPTRSVSYADTSLNSSSRTAAATSRVPALAVSDLAAAPSRLHSTTLPAAKPATKTIPMASVDEPEQSTVRVGAFIVKRSSISPRPGHPTGESPSSPFSPYTVSPVSTPRLSQTTPFGPNALTVYEPCDLFDLHHALQHRLVDELGWSLHWYLDTETEIQQLELAKEMEEKVRTKPRSVADKTNVAVTVATDGVKGSKGEAVEAAAKRSGKARDSAGAALAESGAAAAAVVTPQHSDPNTPQNYRVDAQGRQLPYIKQKSQFGVMSTRVECALCHELAAVRRSAFAVTPRSRLSRSPYEFRLASLRRWLRKRGTESPADALLASCLSVVAQRYLAYLGIADCWTSLFVTAGLPSLHAAAASTALPTAAREKALSFPATLSTPTRLDRVPLSFYVLPALCRWKTLQPARVERLLRTAKMHPFSLLRCFPDVANGTSAKEAAGVSSVASSVASSLVFFTIQQQTYLPDVRRSSSRRNQMASLGESCVCDVYLVASNAPDGFLSSWAAADGSADAATSTTTVASVWGHVPTDEERNGWSSGDGGQDGAGLPPSGELFYIASSLENYLRLGIVFGWVYGWQMCFSTAGPPSNSVPWLRWINASAYAAATAANSETAP
ncbi:hypothetical protein ABB37_05927 [Leptomonas pyrrhocoris]|uniref:Uncharacterized protein n=1 Tax=Leptomonas pyrrhocoris TaxID=157538 RepID=A0A0M9FZ23_LEPPY|nr:hypothetical protein ABB37_05927 [Leptomonas pyrrhocoris]XP_015657289.1 hypothetical protein ABB37_05927 [Leptomonas pyrrhocoris]KPA78849.1 hypothetical protein ABB37_05927 [Leptomonas pyrrhocoris]KPA78850.1 hypothetical protein ABB37_05927 [Leptomonas pyrrhocoris]|eukprot:XP_015657288.1 hypothetical protein ABB37_05927 [Leptomonas pyrrhocoris]